MDTPEHQLPETDSIIQASHPQATYKLVLTAIIMLLLGLGGGYLLFANHASSPKSMSTTTPTMMQPTVIPTMNPQSSSIFTDIKKKLQAEQSTLVGPLDTPKDYSTWWISDDNWNILVPSNEVAVVKIKPLNAETPNKAEMTKLSKLVKDELTKAGYSLDIRNSSKNEMDTEFYDYVQAYKKGDSLCVTTSDPDMESMGDEREMSSRFTFSCFTTTDFEKAFAEQIPFLKALNDHKAVVSNIKINDGGDKAQVAVNWRRTGAAAFFYKSGEEWKLIDEGQAPPDCSALKAKGIPEKYWPACYEGDTLKNNN